MWWFSVDVCLLGYQGVAMQLLKSSVLSFATVFSCWDALGGCHGVAMQLLETFFPVSH